MPRSYSQVYKQKDKHLTNKVESGLVSEKDEGAIRKLCDAFDENKPTVTKPQLRDAPSNITGYKKESTLANWMYFLTEYACEIELTDTTAAELNKVAENWLQGEADHKDATLTKGTIRQYQNAARMFYRYHDNLGVDYEVIATFEANDTKIDPRDMLTPEEIQQVRDAAEHPRDKAIIDMLLYTGMRNTALRSLRIKDVDVEKGRYYFNTDEEGLKGIHRPNEPRPILGAEGAIRDWLDYHPYSDDPDAYFIVGKPKYQNVDPHTRVSHRTIQRTTDKLKENAGIEKPLHPHACRHNFVSICIREYDMEPSTVKFLIGHGQDSSVMESTYQHLAGEDYIKKAEVKAGVREKDAESSFTPNHCDVCNEPLPTEAKACPRCGTVYTPDAKSLEDDLQQAVKESYKETDPEDSETVEEVEAVEKALDDPDVMNDLLENDKVMDKIADKVAEKMSDE